MAMTRRKYDDVSWILIGRRHPLYSGCPGVTTYRTENVKMESAFFNLLINSGVKGETIDIEGRRGNISSEYIVLICVLL